MSSVCSAGQLEELEGEARGPGLEVGRHRRVLQSLAVRGVRGAHQLPVVEVNPELEWRPVSWGHIVISSVLNTEYGGYRWYLLQMVAPAVPAARLLKKCPQMRW